MGPCRSLRDQLRRLLGPHLRTYRPLHDTRSKGRLEQRVGFARPVRPKAHLSRQGRYVGSCEAHSYDHSQVRVLGRQGSLTATRQHTLSLGRTLLRLLLGRLLWRLCPLYFRGLAYISACRAGSSDACCFEPIIYICTMYRQQALRLRSADSSLPGKACMNGGHRVYP
jgi:hypothetical protein